MSNVIYSDRPASFTPNLPTGRTHQQVRDAVSATLQRRSDAVNAFNVNRANAKAAGSNDYANYSFFRTKKGKTFIPTVLSDTNIRDNVIPEIKNRAQQMLAPTQQQMQQQQDTTAGTPINPADNSDNEYASIYESMMGSAPQADPFYDSELAMLQKMQSSSDRRTATQLAGITDQFSQRKSDLAAANQTNQEAQQNSLLRSGTARYAPGNATGIMSAQQRGYVRDLSAIDLEEQQAKNEALMAQEDKDYQLLGKNLDVLKEKRQEKLDTVNKLYDNMIAEQKDTKKAIDGVVAAAVQNGAPVDVLNKIAGAKSSTDAWIAAGNYALSSNTAEGQAYAYAKNNGYSGSPLDFHREWEAAGRKPDTSGSGTNPAYNGDFASTVMLASNIPGATNAARAQTKSDLEDFIANGDWSSAYAQLLTSASAKLKGTAETTFQNQQQSLTAVDDMATALQQLKDAGYDTNKLTGGLEKIGTTLGVLATDPKYAQVATQVYTAFQQYRQNMTGAAFGAKESADYASVLPSASNTFELNLAKIQGARDYLNGQIDGTLKRTVGDGAVEIKRRATQKDISQDIVNNDAQAKDAIATWASSSPENMAQYNEIKGIFPSATPTELKQKLGI